MIVCRSPYSSRKFEAYGLTANSCQWVCNYLCNRVQRTKIRDCKSPWAGITKHVPHGTGLGPMLFNVFINDLFYFVLECKLYNYPDDKILSKVGSTVTDVLESLRVDACNATTWFTANYMKVNPEKFQVMFLNPMRQADQFPNMFSFD